MKREEDVEQEEKPVRKQSGAAIFDALTAFEGPIERDQPTEYQEREALIDAFSDGPISMVTTPETATAIYIAVARERNAEVVPEDIVVHDAQDRWEVFQVLGGGQGDWMNMVRGGGRLELTIMKSDGAVVAAHYSR